MALNTSIDAGARKAIQQAIDVLTPHTEDDRIAALVSKLTAIGDADDQAPLTSSDLKDALDQIEGVSKTATATDTVAALMKAESIAEDESLPDDVRARARKAATALQREQLHAVNPRAAQAWEEAHAI